jgi:hypothetical protein
MYVVSNGDNLFINFALGLFVSALECLAALPTVHEVTCALRTCGVIISSFPAAVAHGCYWPTRVTLYPYFK